jgi:UDP:flavonoid glycosyltransferase YjiC (YdhE family)
LDEMLQPCLTALGGRPDVTLTVAVSPIAERVPTLPAEVRTVSLYPLSPLYRAFDFAVTSCGYNAFHEMIAFGIPSLMIPNRTTKTDDQVVRAEFAARKRLALIGDPTEPAVLATQLERLLSHDAREEIAASCRAVRMCNGAADAAEVLADAAGAG